MPPSIAVICLGVLGVTLAACVVSPTSPPVPVPPPAPVPIDGTYGGLMDLSRGQAINCGNENPITVQVQNHTFTYRLSQPQAEWNPVLVFTATIAADGTFNAQTGSDSMSGSVSAGVMQGQIIGDICAFKFNAAHNGLS